MEPTKDAGEGVGSKGSRMRAFQLGEQPFWIGLVPDPMGRLPRVIFKTFSFRFELIVAWDVHNLQGCVDSLETGNSRFTAYYADASQTGTFQPTIHLNNSLNCVAVKVA